MIIHASISNVLFIYRKKGYANSLLTHQVLQQRLALQLLPNPASVNRKIEVEKPIAKRPSLLRRPSNEHEWKKLPTRLWCVACRPTPSTRRRGKAILQGMDINTTNNRQRGRQTQHGCVEHDVPLCHTSECWDKLHPPRGNDEANEVEEPAET